MSSCHKLVLILVLATRVRLKLQLFQSTRHNYLLGHASDINFAAKDILAFFIKIYRLTEMRQIKLK